MISILNNLKQLKHESLNTAVLFIFIITVGYACNDDLIIDEQSNLGSQVEISITPQIVCVQGVCIDSVTGETIEGEMNDRIDSTLVESWGESIRNIVIRGEAARQSPSNLEPNEKDLIVPFTNIAETVLGYDWKLWNDRPGIVVFDFDRDDDHDLYFTSQAEKSNILLRNDGNNAFTDVTEYAGVGLLDSHSTGALACDFNNDGFQDLYVGAWGDPMDELDFRSTDGIKGSADSLLLNDKDGTFTDVTAQAFGNDINIRSATSISCADVNLDGYLDIFVGNLMAQEFRTFSGANHPGHYDVLYINNQDLTFTEVAESAGVRGTEIVMRDFNSKPILFEDPSNNQWYEGWDPTWTDEQGNQIGEPTYQTHSSMFFDYDDDSDPDLFIASDGDIFRIYRNDTDAEGVKFTEISRALGLDKVGAWMGFAIGDIDSDADLDVFVTNIGYHPNTRPPMRGPSGSCEYHQRFIWGTCLHYLLRNDGIKEIEGVGTVGLFTDIAASTSVIPSPYMPPDSLEISKINSLQKVPTGIQAYDFGFGATFFDMDNDGDQDLYWLGSTVASGQGPGGEAFQGAGRLLMGDGAGNFEDITVRAQVLDIVGVNYKDLDDPDSIFSMKARKISSRFHENGKGLAHGDINNDGYVDLIATNSSGPIWEGTESSIMESPGPVFVWINGGGDNNWIKLLLRGRMAIDGTGSNADGIGARVYVRTIIDGKELIQVQEVRAGSSYISMDSIDLEFGIGKADLVNELVVYWPNGTIQIIKDLEVNKLHKIIEP
ncbi:MAG: hypothetical protein CL904_06640 [Dehalococcoidia bacterium]|nr:hypothetical protein [Dehalococcoidia bacterium]MQG16194.1 CRTAC1 family protein [SAR202 cluster bacterium]|tara:strand:- start:10256 stop:12571 length:2316 start_codon:yes stop_codon:yes gene_type:complete